MGNCFLRLDEEIGQINQKERKYQRELSLSKGFAVFDDSKDKEYTDTFRRADEKMYEDKAEYYKTHDRRKQ